MIDTDNYEASGIEVLRFPGGEFHAKVPDVTLGHVHIFAKIRTWDDFGKFLVVADAYRCMDKTVHVFMPYAPGARQDRIQAGFPLTSSLYPQAMASSIDSLTFTDIHSPAAYEIYRQSLDQPIRDIGFGHIPDLIDQRYDIVLAADAGGVDRAETVASLLGIDTVLRCEKKRDSTTGKLTGFKVPDVPYVAKVLIADDICDGGGTFIGIADELVKTTNNLGLYVTHGIFSKGLDPLLQRFNRVYTTNSWYNGDNPRVFSVDLEPYYMESLTP